MGDFGLILKRKSLIQLHTEAVAGGEKEDGWKRESVGNGAGR